jgi:DNA-binding transcriptional regulator YdaS (Cro superfamily)
MNRLLKARIIERFGNQTDFARLLGISEDRLSKWIHGRLTPGEPEQDLIAKKLGIPTGEIFPSFNQ